MAIFLLSIAWTLIDCTVEKSWYPKGTAEIVEEQTYDVPYIYVSIVVCLRNTSDTTPVSASTISMKIESSERTYYETYVETLRIWPGHEIFRTYELELTGDEEALVEATIVDYYFE